MKAKDESVQGLTKGVEFLLKKNKVDYIKGAGSFVNENEIRVNLIDGGETSVRGKNIVIATGSESTPFPGLEIDEEKVITSTGAIALKEVPKRMIVIGGGIIGLEMVSGSTPSKPSGFMYLLTYLTRALSGPALAPKSLWSSSSHKLVVLVWTPKSASKR